MRRRTWMLRRLALFALVTAAYFVIGRFGASLPLVSTRAVTIWPRTGLSLAMLLVLGRSAWPAVFAGALLVNLQASGPVLAAAIAVADTIGGLVGVRLLDRIGGRHALGRAEGVFAFAGFVVPVAAAVGALLGGASLALATQRTLASVGASTLTWWLGDSAGAIVMTPLALLWRARPRLRWDLRRSVEGAVLLLVLVLTALVVFRGFLIPLTPGTPVSFLVLPTLLWCAFRFGPRETITGCAFLGGFAFWGTLDGLGPFGRLATGGSLAPLGMYVAVTTVVMLAASTAVASRQAAEDELTRLNAGLERRVADRTEELHRMHARLIEAQRVGHIGSWEWSIERNTIWWSDELYRIFGVDPERFAASYEGYLTLIHPEDREPLDASVRRALETRQAFVVEHRIVHPDGDVRTIHGRGRVVTDAGGRPILMLGTAQDITDRRRADEERLQLAHEQALRREAEAANQAKDEFLTILSHELRTPVNAVMGWAQLLEQGRLDEPGRRKALDAIRRNATIQTELVSDILDASRIRTGTLSLDRQPMELSAAIENAVDSVRPAALAKGIQIATELQPVSIVGDVQRLGQVVRNLLTNSVKFASSGGRIRLSSWCVDSHVAIVVEDDGPGISPDFLPHLFEQFRQADPSTTREHQGLGLGLAIVRRIVESHGGTVDASNRTDGQGAVFTVRLPLEPEPASPTFHSG